jgi:hypothetical protein
MYLPYLDCVIKQSDSLATSHFVSRWRSRGYNPLWRSISTDLSHTFRTLDLATLPYNSDATFPFETRTHQIRGWANSFSLADQEPSMTWLSPVDRTSGTLTLSAGTLSCLAHHGTPISERCPTTTALERTTVLLN